MRYSIMLLFTMTLFSCKKDEPIAPIIFESAELHQHPDWNAEPLKYDYTIQFPDNYTGGYVQGIEGAWFDKVRDDEKISMSYNFNNGLQNFDFGDTLLNENDTALVLEQGDLLYLLNNRINYTENGVVQGILFYNLIDNIRIGELYLKENGIFRDALTIYYNEELQDEAFEIVATINHK